MALANVAALLAKWGRSVLIVDWDLEASGIESFFEGVTPGLRDLRRTKPGVVDLIIAKGEGNEIDWAECLIDAYPFGATNPVSMITAGRSREGFTERMQSLDFARLFAESDLGSYIEKLRNEWTSKFNTVLIDSRTGITDIGGICTIHLPDVLVLLFTTTETSVRGVIDVITAAREQQSKLPFERQRLRLCRYRPETTAERNTRRLRNGEQFLLIASLITTETGYRRGALPSMCSGCFAFLMYHFGALASPYPSLSRRNHRVWERRTMCWPG